MPRGLVAVDQCKRILESVIALRKLYDDSSISS